MNVRITGKQLQSATRSRQAKGIAKKPIGDVVDRRMIIQADAEISENYVQEAAIPGADPDFKNIQKRVLGRKFIAIWIEKVFGRVSPFKARDLLVKKMKKRYFEQWYHVYWQSRIEWKLNIRADCHNRYQLFSKYWVGWKQFVELRKDMRARVASVRRTVLVKLQEESFNAWVVFVQITRARRDVKQKALELGNRSRLRSAWHTWLAEHRLKAHRYTLQMHVEQKRQKRLMIWVWLKWKEARDQSALESERHTLAVQLYCLKLLTLGMKRWKMYIKANKEQARMNAVAVSHYQNEVLVRSYVVWYQRLQRVTELKQLQQLIESMKMKAKLKRYLRFWKTYVKCEQKEQQQKDQAMDWHRRSLQRRCLVWMMKCAAQRHKEKQEECAACQFRNDKILRHWWQMWMFHLEVVEEKKMVPKTEMALAKSRASILKTAFHAWLQYHSMKQTELATRLLVDIRVKKKLFHRVKKKLFHRYFSAWKEYHNQAYQQKALKLKGIQYQRESLLAIVFYIWMDSAVRRQEGAALRERAIAYHDDQLKKAVFKVWRTRAVEEKKLTAMQTQAMQYCNRMVLLRVFTVWQSQWKHRLTEDENKEVSEMYHRRRSMGVIWQAWMNYIEMKRYKRHKQLLADNCHARSLCQKVLNGWKVWHACHQTKEAGYAAASALYHRKLQRHCVQMWQGNVSLLKNAKYMMTAAVQHYQTTVLQKYYDMWKKMTFGTCAITNKQTDVLYATASALDARSKLCRTFSVWRCATILRIDEQACLTSAETCYTKSVMRKCLLAWKHHQHFQLRKKLLAQQCLWFRDIRIVSSFYSRWRVMFSQKLLEKSKSSLALWHWSRGLKHKHVSQKTTIRENNLIQQKEETERPLALQCVRHWKQVTQKRLHARKSEHMPLPSAGGTMNVSGGETLLQTRVPTFLNQHGFSQSMHYIADAQEKPTTDGTFVSEEVLKLKESASANSTDAASMIMKARDMLLELYRARVEQRTLCNKLQSLNPLSTEYTRVQKELHNVNSFLSVHEGLVVKAISDVHQFTTV